MLGLFRPGVFAATYGGSDIGLTTSAGWRFRYQLAGRRIEDTNQFGEACIDIIHRGMKNTKLIVTLKEALPIVRRALWPYGSTTFASNEFDGKQASVGWLATQFAQAIVLTAEAGSPAAIQGDVANTPGTAWNVCTFHKCILAPENDVEYIFAPEETDVPVIFDVLLDDQTGVKRFFTFS